MTIPDIKARLSIQTVLQHYGLVVDKTNRLHCPWHEDRTPSLQIFPKTDSWTCFSSKCDAGSGDQIEFCVRMEGDKHRGIRVAQSLVTDQQPALSTVTPNPGEELSRIAVLSKVAQESKAHFKKVAKARQYVQSRGLDLEKTEVGYIGSETGKGWNEALQQSALQLGVLRKTKNGKLVPTFRQCVVFFLKNAQEQIVGLYGRSVVEEAQPKHLYLSGQHQGLYPQYPHGMASYLVLTESVIDAATLQQHTDYQVLALYGTQGLTAEHEAVIKTLPELQEVILFLDGDEAGRAAITKLTEKLQQIRPAITISAVATPEGEDVNSLVSGHEPSIFNHLLAERTPVRFLAGTGTPVGTVANQATAEGATIPLAESEKSNVRPAPTSGKLDTSNPEKLLYQSGSLSFTVWGGVDIAQLHRLKVNLHVQLVENRNAWQYYQDDVNLYSNSQLVRYLQGASEALEVSTTVLKQSLHELKSQLENYRWQQREHRERALQPKTYPLSGSEEKEALALLQDKQLVRKTLEAITGTGLVGEQKNGLLLFFLYLTRMFEEPLHAIIFGKSGSGKTYLQTKISACLPPEAVRNITSLSENVLYYSPKGFWQHVVLVIEDLDGVYQALLALRELMSKQSITKYTTDKDAKGNNIQRALTVEGPVSVSGATTKERIYEDNANRSFLLYVDESPAHLEQVMDYQRKARARMINKTAQQTQQLLLQNAQRLLDKSIQVYNPYALDLKLPPALFKPLRTNEHYLKLIDVIAFYHQKQRPIKTHPTTQERYLEVTLADIECANWLVRESLLRKSDELTGELRQFLECLKEYINRHHPDNPEGTFYAKDIRKERRMHPMKLSRYLLQLEQRGYLKQTGGNRQTGYEYQIIAWQEYQTLQAGMDILDQTLEQLRARKTASG